MSDKKFKKGLFLASDFAKFSRTTKDTLLHYEKIGLLKPVARGENNYRYYSGEQLAIINVIRTFQELGMSLSEIKAYKDNRSPQNVFDVFDKQIEKIDSKINSWIRSKKLLLTLQNTIRSTMDVNEEAITVKYLQAEAIVLGNSNDYSKKRDDYDALLNFYRSMRKKYPDLNFNYPVWGLFSEERIKKGDWVWPDRYYFYNSEGYDKRPAGLYAVGYARGGYGQSDGLYKRIIDYIDKNGFEVCGNAYEEYPLNEVSVADSNEYLLRILIAVREKSTRNPNL